MTSIYPTNYNIITSPAKLTSLSTVKNIYIGSGDLTIDLSEIEYFAESFFIGNKSTSNINVVISEGFTRKVFPGYFASFLYDGYKYIIAGVTNPPSSGLNIAVLSTNAGPPIAVEQTLRFVTLINPRNPGLTVTSSTTNNVATISNSTPYSWLVIARTSFIISGAASKMAYWLRINTSITTAPGNVSNTLSSVDLDSMVQTVMAPNTQATLTCIITNPSSTATAIGTGSFVMIEFFSDYIGCTRIPCSSVILCRTNSCQYN